MRTGPVCVAAAVLVTLGAGCSDGSPAAGTDPAVVTPSATAVATASGTPATGIPRLRLDDDGSTVTLSLGGTAVLFLPTEDWTWSDPRSDGPAVSVSEDVSDEGSPSRSWTLTARDRGVATVTATGTPTCRTAPDPCSSPARVFAVDVVVT